MNVTRQEGNFQMLGLRFDAMIASFDFQYRHLDEIFHYKYWNEISEDARNSNIH